MEVSASGKWQESLHTCSGKLVENTHPGHCKRLPVRLWTGKPVKALHPVFHVHDEIITETDDMGFCPKDLVALMCEPIPWAPGLILKAAGLKIFYRKD